MSQIKIDHVGKNTGMYQIQGIQERPIFVSKNRLVDICSRIKKGEKLPFQSVPIVAKKGEKTIRDIEVKACDGKVMIKEFEELI